MGLPKSFNLFSGEGHHAGFMLLSPRSASEGDCVFMLSPFSADGIDSRLGLVVSELKVGGEHRFEFAEVEGGFQMTLQPDGFPAVRFQFDEEYSGEIFTEFDGKEVGIGTASPAKKSDA
ncbi:hypothetical protein ACYFX5_06965 [Bremerella sp. T1]|uniref:hypothetical protein n=1 Tax=Bremerella sp. TYQ1 TaxID=3119568 RepID=UPI001CCCFD23|nr:hypothetical protein [Bremerella volcania]UBM37997.1 hypothetical protein LA756_08900 [Bremerella volcania]